jgi:hypothetical protein
MLTWPFIEHLGCTKLLQGDKVSLVIPELEDRSKKRLSTAAMFWI